MLELFLLVELLTLGFLSYKKVKNARVLLTLFVGFGEMILREAHWLHATVFCLVTSQLAVGIRRRSETPPTTQIHLKDNLTIQLSAESRTKVSLSVLLESFLRSSIELPILLIGLF